jgi:hypothetical protein
MTSCTARYETNVFRNKRIAHVVVVYNLNNTQNHPRIRHSQEIREKAKPYQLISSSSSSLYDVTSFCPAPPVLEASSNNCSI